MAVQLMRQVRRAIDPDWDVHQALGEAIAALEAYAEPLIARRSSLQSALNHVDEELLAASDSSGVG